MEYIIRLEDEERYNDIGHKIGWYRWDARHAWDHHTRQGFHAIKVPEKGRARWLRRNGPMLEKWGFTLIKEVEDAKSCNTIGSGSH